MTKADMEPSISYGKPVMMDDNMEQEDLEQAASIKEAEELFRKRSTQKTLVVL